MFNGSMDKKESYSRALKMLKIFYLERSGNQGILHYMHRKIEMGVNRFTNDLVLFVNS